MRSWLANVDYCIEHGLTIYACGQAGYAGKLRLVARSPETPCFFATETAGSTACCAG